MQGFRKLLFPVDFSDRCVQTLPYVAGIARKFQSCVVLLHAVNAYDAFGYGVPQSTNLYGTSVPILWEQRKAAMAAFGESILEGLAVERAIEDGEPSGAIVRYARDHAIDLIVMPTHGYGGFRRLVLGSVTTQVLHNAQCAVWTTAHSEKLDERCGQCITRMVCGVDLGDDSVRVVQCALALAEQYGATLRLVHAVGSDALNADVPFQRFLMDTALEKLAALQRQTHTECDTWVRHGDTSAVLREASVDFAAGLCIVGRGHANKPFGSLRTHVNAIIRESECPVVSF